MCLQPAVVFVVLLFVVVCCWCVVVACFVVVLLLFAPEHPTDNNNLNNNNNWFSVFSPFLHCLSLFFNFFYNCFSTFSLCFLPSVLPSLSFSSILSSSRDKKGTERERKTATRRGTKDREEEDRIKLSRIELMEG